MFKIDETPIMWLWVDETTGICFPETMSHTEAMAQRDAERILGKRRMVGGDMKAVRVAIIPLSDAEVAAHRDEFAAWKAKKAAEQAERAARYATPQQEQPR